MHPMGRSDGDGARRPHAPDGEAGRRRRAEAARTPTGRPDDDGGGRICRRGRGRPDGTLAIRRGIEREATSDGGWVGPGAAGAGRGGGAPLHRAQNLGGEGCSLLPHGHFWIASQRVVALGRVGPAAVEVKEGLMNAIALGDYRSFVLRRPLVDYGDAVVMPGLIDVHAHLDEPGRAEWEGFSTGTRAAAAAGQINVYTSNEIGDDRDIPHAAIGGARRMQEPEPST